MKHATAAAKIIPSSARPSDESERPALVRQGLHGKPPTSPTALADPGNGHDVLAIRMYTDEQVSEIMQVSLSQLRKWRMKRNRGKSQGPPFRKIGRLVRYPGPALQAYINGESTEED